MPFLDFAAYTAARLTFRCTSCRASDDVVDFTAFEAGETLDRVCDDCHHEHAAQAAEDESNRRARLYG